MDRQIEVALQEEGVAIVSGTNIAGKYALHVANATIEAAGRILTCWWAK